MAVGASVLHTFDVDLIAHASALAAVAAELPVAPEVEPQQGKLIE